MNASFLDQIMMEDISRHCTSEFMAFHQCMSKPPSEDTCVPEQENLKTCIKSKVPVFQKINSLCADKLQDYEACLRANGTQGACKPQLSSLRDCALGALQKDS